MFDSLASHYTEHTGWDVNTLYLYTFVVIVSGIFGYLSRYSKPVFVNNILYYRGSSRFNREPYVLCFVILLVIQGFRTIGTDYITYRNIFNESILPDNSWFSIEPLFKIANRIIYISGFSFEFAVFVFSFITLYFVFKSISFYSSKIDISLALFAFGSLYYLPSFNMLRMYLAASLTLYLYKYLLLKQYKSFFAILGLVCFIHYSAILFFIPTIGVIIYEKSKRLFWIYFIFLWFAAFKIATILSEITMIERYQHYTSADSTDSSFGFLHWVINIPIILLYRYSKKKLRSSPFLSSLIVLTTCELLIGLLSYKVMMIGRSLVYYNVLFIIVIPIIINQLIIKHAKWGRIIKWIYYIYLFYRFYLYLSEYLYSDGIMPYKSIL